MKIFIRTFFYLLILVVGLEFMFQILFFITKHHFLKNKYEFETSIYNNQSINIYPENIFRDNYKINIATFGGSSTRGDASQISFSSIIKNYFYYTDKDINLVNYGILGIPFAGYTSELIKDEMHKYDIIIIYSGHNEWELGEYSLEYFDNGFPHPTTALLKKKLKNDLKIQKSKVNIITGGDKIFNQYTSYSRLLNFLFRTFDKAKWFINVKRTKNYLKELKSIDLFVNPPRQFYYDKQDVNDKMRAKWINEYFLELNSIIDSLQDDQKLIISTVMSDIFFPPLYDFYKDYDVKTNALFASAYQSLINKQTIDLESLPDSANKYFLEGYQCLIQNIKNKNICYQSLIKAKDYDNIAFRIQSDINNGIKQINKKNVIIIDPLKSVLENAKTIDEFREYLADYHHPSPKGHLLIANNILSKIILEKHMPQFEIIDNCGSYRMQINEDEIHDILINHNYCKEVAIKRFKHLTNIIRLVPKEIRFFYNFHNNNIANVLNIKSKNLKKELLSEEEYKFHAK